MREELTYIPEGREVCELCNFTMDKIWLKKVEIGRNTYFICDECCKAIEEAEFCEE